MKAREQIGANIVRKAHMAPAAVGQTQRCTELEVLGLVCGIDHQRVGVWPLEDAVPDAGYRIGRDPEGERWIARLQKVVRSILGGINIRVGEAQVDEDAIGAADVDVDGIEHAPPAFIRVETEVDEVAQVAAGLRTARGIDPPDTRLAVVPPVMLAFGLVVAAAPLESERIGIAGAVGVS